MCKGADMDWVVEHVDAMLEGREVLLVLANTGSVHYFFECVEAIAGRAVSIDYDRMVVSSRQGAGKITLAVLGGSGGEPLSVSYCSFGPCIKLGGSEPVVTSSDAEVSLMPLDEWSIGVGGGKLIVSVWSRGELVHPVAFPLLESGDKRVSLNDLEDAFGNFRYMLTRIRK